MQYALRAGFCVSLEVRSGTALKPCHPDRELAFSLEGIRERREVSLALMTRKLQIHRVFTSIGLLGAP